METDTEIFQIHEVYYDDKHQIEGWTELPIAPMGESLLALKSDMDLMRKAFEKPVLFEQRENNEDILVEAPVNGS